MLSLKNLTSALFTFAALTVSAETFVNESFNYPTGNLIGNGEWVKYGQKTSFPVNVVENGLCFADYQDNTAGNSVQLTKESGECTQILFRDHGSNAFDGVVYYSCLINVSELPSGTKTTAFINLTGSHSLDSEQYGDGVSGSEGGGVFAQLSGEGFNLGISRNVANMGNAKNAVTWGTDVYELNTTYLIVVKYEPVVGDANDIISLWVNPTKESTDDSAIVANEGGDIVESLSDIRGIELRQGSSMVAKNPVVQIDELRVASTWNEIFTSEGNEKPATTPTLTLSEMALDYGKVYQGLRYNKTLNIKGQNLTDDIHIKGMTTGNLSTGGITTIAKEDAESKDGYNLDIELYINDVSHYSDDIIFESADAQTRIMTCQWHPQKATTVNTLKELYDESSIDMSTVYVYAGEATVTCVDTDFYTFYAQDATGAIEVRSAKGCGYEEIDIEKVKEGDNVTTLIGNVVFSDDGGIDFVPVNPSAWEKTSDGNSVTPIELTFEQINNAQASDVMFRLVSVKDIVFDTKYADRPDFYDKFNSPYHIVADNTRSGWLWYLHGTDIYNKPTEGYFTKIWTVTGICYYMAPTPAIAPRRLNDFKEQDNSAVVEIATGDTSVAEIYDLCGRKVENPGRGLFILKMSDGTVRKIRL